MSNAKIGTCGACNFRIAGKCTVAESCYSTVASEFTGCYGEYYNDSELSKCIAKQPIVAICDDYGVSYHWYNETLYSLSYDGYIKESKVKCDINITTGFGTELKVYNMDRF